ncbi:transposase family protein [Companilactobacillus halodurans]|nr:transposase family protein [Companilactobacillus halodurans]
MNLLVKNSKRITNARLASFNGVEYHLVIKKQRFLCRNCGGTYGAHSDLLIKNHTMTKQVKHRIFSTTKIIGISTSTVGKILYGNTKTLYKCEHLPENICFDEFRSVKILLHL